MDEGARLERHGSNRSGAEEGSTQLASITSEKDAGVDGAVDVLAAEAEVMELFSMGIRGTV